MASFKGKVSDTGDFKGEVNIEGVTEAGKKQTAQQEPVCQRPAAGCAGVFEVTVIKFLNKVYFGNFNLQKCFHIFVLM